MDAISEINRSYFLDKSSHNYKNDNTEDTQIKINITSSSKTTINSQEKNFSALLNLELIDRKISSDSTSISNSQMENLSQTSESSNIHSSYNLNNNEIKEFQKEDEEGGNYFFGIENYFLKIMPEKFNEYKKSKNFLPKCKIKKKEEKKEVKNEDIILEKKEDKNLTENNNINQNERTMKNNRYYPTFGSIFYFSYNPFCFNYQLQKNSNNNLNNINYKEQITHQKKQYKYENKKEKNEDKDIFYEHNSNNEQDVYILEKQKPYNDRTKPKFKEKKQRNNFNDELIIDSFYNRNNCNFRFKNYNSKYNKNCNNIYYQIKENNFENNKNHYNYKKFHKIKHFKVIYY